uniref:Uncharacterized protein n=1 Tax=Helianthus annuus TaxID=4232 RepID=A0A251SJC4_HELAN
MQIIVMKLVDLKEFGSEAVLKEYGLVTHENLVSCYDHMGSSAMCETSGHG